MNTAPMARSNIVPKAESLKLLNISENSNIKYCAIIGRLFKIHPIFDDAIIRILQNTDDNNTYIVFIAENVVNFNRIFHRRLQESFNSHNLSHLLPRVRLVDFSLYSHVLNSAVCVLDTFPYGGCLTTHDAFSHGVPMVVYCHLLSSFIIFMKEFCPKSFKYSFFTRTGNTTIGACKRSIYIRYVQTNEPY